MEENNQNPKDEDFLNDLPVRGEEIGFKTEELAACRKCARLNAPNRLKCMYCGGELELSAAQTAAVAPALRKLENWENGFNLIYLPGGENISAGQTAQLAKLVGLEKESLEKIFEARKSLPIARAESAREAEILQTRLSEQGLAGRIVGDEQLAAETPPTRLRGLEFRGDRILLILFNNDEVEEIAAADLNLIVPGAIFQKTIESLEARKKGTTKILDATETASDEILIDIYTKAGAHGYRIWTKGFDFSCLEAEKGMLARENIRKLTVKLAQHAPHARLVDDYLAVRNLLGEIWEVEQRTDAQGLTRQRFGKFDLSNVSSSSNLQQFTKYSRLQRHIL